MRKRILLLALLFVGAVSAQTVSVDDAMRAATDFLRRSAMSGQSAMTNSFRPTLKFAAAIEEDSRPSMYAFDIEGGGFVIAGADACAYPVLLYSESGNFDIDNANPAFRMWIDGFSRQIEEARSITGASVSDNPSTDTEPASDRISIEPLVKTQWDQFYPYNMYCPKTLNGKTTLTGCVATAMAQVMKCHEWPESGEGSLEYSEWTTPITRETLSTDFESHRYRWKDMVNEYIYLTTEEQDTAVAQLMYDAGVSIHTDYGTINTGGSSAYMEMIPYALASHFRYDKGIRHLDRNYYTDSEWSELVYSELAAGQPVIYGGATEREEGHAFICDGYDSSSDTYHFNWGWSGSEDCWAKLEAVACKSYSYQYYQDIVIGIRKPVEGNQPFKEVLVSEYTSLSVVRLTEPFPLCMIRFDVDRKKADTLDPGCFYSTCYEGFRAIFNLEFRNVDTGETFYAETSSSNYFDFQANDSPSHLHKEYLSPGMVVQEPELPAGSYLVRPVYKTAEEYEQGEETCWHNIRTSVGYADGTVISVGDVSGITPLNKKADAPTFDLSGRRADASAHGIVISEGKKYLK